MSSSENWVLKIDPSVFKTLRKIPRPSAQVILEVIKLLPTNPYFGDIQKMKGERNAWRRRVGAYRVFFKIIIGSKTVLVFHLERRTTQTY